MPSRYVRIPPRLAVEPLEVMINQTLGRILATPQDFRSREDREKEPRPKVLAGAWFHYNWEEATPFDLRANDVVEVDLDVDLNSYILGHAARRHGLIDLAVALMSKDFDLAEELLTLLCQLENV
jgi:hypothetical protein